MFQKEGNWYKGNLHTHTTESDGQRTKEEVIRLYREAGYDFLALTDHWVESDTMMQDGMLLLSGCEWDTGDMIKHPIYHILGIAMQRKVGLERTNTYPPQFLIDQIRKAGGIAILAHPMWSLTDPAKALELEGLAGAEIFNSVSDAEFSNGRRADSSLYFDLWADKGRIMPCFAQDDSHWYKGEQTRSYIMVKAKELTRDAILEAIAEGSFYASQGPRFESVEVKEGKITVKCSAAERVIFYSNIIWAEDRSQILNGDSAVYKVKPTDKYVRVELIDKEGKMAWTSPFWV